MPDRGARQRWRGDASHKEERSFVGKMSNKGPPIQSQNSHPKLDNSLCLAIFHPTPCCLRQTNARRRHTGLASDDRTPLAAMMMNLLCCLPATDISDDDDAEQKQHSHPPPLKSHHRMFLFASPTGRCLVAYSCHTTTTTARTAASASSPSPLPFTPLKIRVRAYPLIAPCVIAKLIRSTTETAYLPPFYHSQPRC